jgi:hypothetical protein
MPAYCANILWKKSTAKTLKYTNILFCNDLTFTFIVEKYPNFYYFPHFNKKEEIGGSR